jgi:hypothetical protein
MRLALLCVALAACGGRPVQSKQDLAESFADASIPAVDAKGAALSLLENRALPEPSITVRGKGGGEATLSFNPVGGAVGLAGKGVLFDVKYSGYSEDGHHALDGSVSVLATFDYVAASPEGAYGDLKLSIVGRLQLRGIISDEVQANVTVLTRFHDLSFREDSIEMRLTGKASAHGEEYAFADEDLSMLWKQRAP